MGTTEADWAQFGVLLKSHRRASGLTQQELAERAGYSVVYISMLERGERRPQTATLDALSAALGLTSIDRASLEGALRVEPSSLVGRGVEVEILRRHLDGQGPPVLVLAGEPGIGKSRLLREARKIAATQGWKVLEGGCARRGEEPFSPLLGAIQQYVRKQDEGAVRRELGGCSWLLRLLPELEPWLEAPGPLQPDQEHRLIIDALGRFLAQAAGPAGTVLVLDDLQWAGSDVLAAIARLVAAHETIRLVAAYRDVEVADGGPLALWLGELAQDELVVHHALPRLDRAQSEVMLEHLLDGVKLDVELRHQALTVAAGLPFFIASFAQEVRAAMSQGRTPELIPWDVRQGILHRVVGLPAVARETVEVAAVAGRSTPRQILAEATGHDAATLTEALEQICRAGILIEDGDRRYRFSHDVLRDVVETSLSAARRREIHRRVGAALETFGAVEEIAYHYAHSDQDETAVTYLERAGDRARERRAHDAAAGYYRELVDRLDDLQRTAEAAAAREKLGDTLLWSGRFDEALSVLEDAARQWSDLRWPDREWMVVARIGRVHERRGTPAEGIERLERLRVVPGRRPARVHAEMEAALAPLFLLTGRYDEQLAAAERAAGLAREAGDDRLLGEAEVWRGCALNQLGRLDEGRASQERAVVLAESAGDLPSLLHAVNDIGFLAEIRGEFERSRHYKERALELAERGGDPLSIATMAFRCGQNAFLRGDWRKAADLFEQGRLLSRHLGTSSIAAYPPFGLALLAFARGDVPTARRFAEETLRIAARTDQQASEGALALLAECDLAEGQAAAGLERLSEIAVDGLGLYPAGQVLAACLLVAGRQAQAADAAEEAVRRAEARKHQVALVDALRVRGLAAGRYDDLRHALRLARSMGYPFGELRVLQALAIPGEAEPQRIAEIRHGLEDAFDYVSTA